MYNSKFLDETGKIKPMLKVLTQDRAYPTFQAANSLLGNIRKHYPELKLEIVQDNSKTQLTFAGIETERNYYVRLIE